MIYAFYTSTNDAVMGDKLLKNVVAVTGERLKKKADTSLDTNLEIFSSHSSSAYKIFDFRYRFVIPINLSNKKLLTKNYY